MSRVLAVATTPDEQASAEGVLDHHGAQVIEVVEPHPRRRVILARLADEDRSATVAAALRGEGLLAVSRPSRGGALRAWVRDTEPVVISDRLSVSPAWSEHRRCHLRGLVELGPGGFGSGHHPTTRLLLGIIEERITGGESVLDVGCGSGILGLAALTLGADRATGTDFKAAAVAATARNARLNNLSARLVTSTNPIEHIGGSFDVVVANIARAGVVGSAAGLLGAIAPNGWLAVSGITPSQCAQVAGFLRPLVVVEERIENDWAGLVLAPPK